MNLLSYKIMAWPYDFRCKDYVVMNIKIDIKMRVLKHTLYNLFFLKCNLQGEFCFLKNARAHPSHPMQSPESYLQASELQLLSQKFFCVSRL